MSDFRLKVIVWTVAGLALAAGWALDLHRVLIFWVKGGEGAVDLAVKVVWAKVGYAAALGLAPPLAPALGFLAGGLVLGVQAKSKDREAGGWWLALGAFSLLPLPLYFLLREARAALSLPPLAPQALVPWGVGVAGGIAAALAWLRWGAPAVDTTRHKLSRKAAQERNKKTDVREIKDMLPQEIGKYDPERHFSKRALFVGLGEDRRPVTIDWETWSLSHVLLSGRTRSGKGVAAQILLTQAIARGELVVVLDPKGDEWMPHVFCLACRKAGRPYRFVDLRPSAPAQINPFAQASAEEIETMLIAAFGLAEKGEAADFYRLADRKAAREAAALLAQGLSPTEVLEKAGTAWLERAAGFHAYFQEMVELPSVGGDPLDWRGWAQSGGCLYFAGDMINPRVIRMQRLIAVRLMLLAKRLQEEGVERRTICLFADEFKTHISRPFMTALGAAAGWGLHCILAFQSLQDLADVPADLDRDAVRGAVMENCGVQLSYAVKDPETAEWLARSTGKIQVDDEMRRVERNIALSETVLPERTIRQSERFYIDENMFLMLPKGCAVLTVPGELAQFVFTAPIRVEKDPAAVEVVATGGRLAGMKAEQGEEEEEEPEAPKSTDGIHEGEGADFV